MRFLVAVGFLLFLNGYAFVRIWDRLPWVQRHVGLSLGIAIFFFLLQITAFFLDRFLFLQLRETESIEILNQVIDWISYGALGVLSCLVTYLLLADIITTLWVLITPPDDLPLFKYRSMLIVGCITVVSVTIGMIQAAAGPRVVKQEITLATLPAGFDGYRIAQISDLHVSSMIKKRYVQNVVAQTNALDADAIMLTGDIVDGVVESLKDDVAPLAALKAKDGVYFVTGNHEYYWGVQQWLAEFKRLGMHLLLNEHALITRGNNDAVILAGITDYSAGSMIAAHTPDTGKAFQGAPENLTKILLAHQPASYKMAEAAKVDLMLSGHTHCGQFFPFSLFIRFFQRYYKGLNRHGALQIYVNSGTGYWGPPLRTGVPPEITLITLRSPN